MSNIDLIFKCKYILYICALFISYDIITHILYVTEGRPHSLHPLPHVCRAGSDWSDCCLHPTRQTSLWEGPFNSPL